MKPLLILILILASGLILIRVFESVSSVKMPDRVPSMIQNSSGPCLHPDYDVLVALYNSTNGPSWNNKTNWLDTCDVCLWYGVTCDGNNQVTHLDLSGNRLSGSIPAELEGLVSLISLNLERNSLAGTIPEEISNPPLQFLSLASNNLSGTLPASFNNLAPTLEELYITNNYLSGSFPAELGSLTNLRVLSMENNQFVGAIDPGIGNLTNLEIFYCGGMPLTSIPSTIGNMTSLVELYLSFNQITSIPPELGNLANIEQIYMEYNQLSGTIPKELGQLGSLQALALEGNYLQGEIPAEFSDLSNLRYLFVGSNQLSGFLPPGLGYLPLVFLEVWNNNFQGCIPASYSNFCASGAGFYFENNPCLWQGTFTQFCNDTPCSFTDYTLVPASGSAICLGSQTTLETTGANTFLWSTGESTPAISIAPLDDTWYYITLTTLGGCTRMDSILIKVNAGPVADVSGTDVSTFGGNDGSAIASATGGIAPYSYLWNTGASTSNINSLSAGNYTCTITDGNGCQDEASILINQPNCLPSGSPCNDSNPDTYDDVEDGTCNCAGIPCPMVAAGLTISDIRCYGTSDASAYVNPAGGVGPYLVNWSNGASGNMISSLGPGSYSVTITDGNGCFISSNFSISEPPLLVTNLVGSDESLPGAVDGAVHATVSGGSPPYIYLWSTGATTKDITGLKGENTTYKVTITDDHGCSMVDQVTISTGCLVQGTVCDDGDPTTYNDVEDGNCACAGVPCASINLNFFMANVSCFGASDANASVNPSGGVQPYTIEWSEGSHSAQLDNLAPGNYAVTVGDQTGCIGTRNFVLIEPSELELVLYGQDESIAGSNDGAVDLAVSGGSYPYSFVWSSGETIQDLDQLKGDGTWYSVTVTDAQGCQKFDSIQIFTGCLPMGTPCDDGNPLTYEDQQDGDCACIGIPCRPIQINAKKSNISCLGATDGEIILNPSGGHEPYRFVWSNGSAESFLANLSAGLYFVTVSDYSGCAESSFFLITQPDTLQIKATITPATTAQMADGGIELHISGGTPPYAATWLDGLKDQARQELLPGSYIVDVVDNNGCTRRDTFIVTNVCPDFARVCDDGDPNTIGDNYDESCNCIGRLCGLDIVPQLSHISCFGMPFGTAIIDTAGLSVSTINWSTGAVGDRIVDLNAGVYQLTVTTNDGCTSELAIEILQPDSIILTLSGGDETGPNAMNGYAGVSISGGISPYHIVWSTGDSVSLIENLSGNQYYRVEVTDAEGCQVNDSIYIAEFVCAGLIEGAFIPKILPDTECQEKITLIIEVHDGNPEDFAFSLDGVIFQNSPRFTGLGAEVYTPFVRNRSNGCQYLLSDVEIGTLLDLKFSVIEPSSCTSSDGAIEITNHEYQIGLSKEGPWYSGVMPDLSAGEYRIFALRIGEHCPTIIGNVQVGAKTLDPGALNVTKSNARCGEDFGKIEILSVSTDISFSIDHGGHWYKNPQFFEASPGRYELLVRTNDGCISVHSTIDIENTSHLDIAGFSGIPPGNCAEEDGIIKIFSNDLGKFSIDGGLTWLLHPEFTNLGVGLYQVLVSDINDLCLDSIEVILNGEDNVKQIIVEDKLDPSCYNAEDGYIRLGVADHHSNLKWHWNNGVEGPELGRLKAGVYDVQLHSSPYCYEEARFELVNPDPISFDFPPIDTAQYCQGEIISIQLLDTGLHYTWYHEGEILTVGNKIELVQEGKYELLANDNNGCETSKAFEIAFSDELFSANFLVSAIAIAGRPLNAIEISWPVPDKVFWQVEGGIIQDIFQNQSTLVFEEPGEYTITLKAVKGDCMSIVQKSIIVQEDNGQLMFPAFEPEQSIRLTLFPNPNLGNFNALIELDEPSDIQIRIYNEEAQSIYSAKFKSVEVLSHNIDLTGSLPGIYTLVVYTNTVWRFVNFVIE